MCGAARQGQGRRQGAEVRGILKKLDVQPSQKPDRPGEFHRRPVTARPNPSGGSEVPGGPSDPRAAPAGMPNRTCYGRAGRNGCASAAPAQSVVLFRSGVPLDHSGSHSNARFSLPLLVRMGSTPARANHPLRGIPYLTHPSNLTLTVEAPKNFCFSCRISLSKFQTGRPETLANAGGAQ